MYNAISPLCGEFTKRETSLNSATLMRSSAKCAVHKIVDHPRRGGRGGISGNVTSGSSTTGGDCENRFCRNDPLSPSDWVCVGTGSAVAVFTFADAADPFAG